MEPESILGAILAGIVIGLVARILVPSMQPIGCIVTVIIGIIGAFLGLAVSSFFGYSNWFFVFLTQVFIATILVAVTAALFRRA